MFFLHIFSKFAIGIEIMHGVFVIILKLFFINFGFNFQTVVLPLYISKGRCFCQ